MRTTFDISDALMLEVNARAAAEGRSLKSVVGEALALGLHKKSGRQERWVCPASPLGASRADYTHAWALVESLEASAVAEKLDLGQ